VWGMNMSIETLCIFTLKGIAFGFGILIGGYIAFYVIDNILSKTVWKQSKN
jgi:hypothetical protein